MTQKECIWGINRCMVISKLKCGQRSECISVITTKPEPFQPTLHTSGCNNHGDKIRD